jgi:hypothetical protein
MCEQHNTGRGEEGPEGDGAMCVARLGTGEGVCVCMCVGVGV